MNYKMIRFLVGKIMLVEAVVLLVPLLVSFIYREPLIYKLSFIITSLVLIFVYMFSCKKKPKDTKMGTVDGLLIVALSWIALSVFGSFPFVISREIPSFIDAFFETSSGFTTTGASILDNVEALSNSMLFWRSLTHLLGGMGVLVFALAVLPSTEKDKLDSLFVMKAEIPGPIFGKLVSKMRTTARILYSIYLVMTLILILVLILAGMPVFDSIIHAMGTAGTGGFSIKNGSIGHYNSSVAEVILGVGMIIFGINFNLYYALLRRQFGVIKENDEFKLYLKIIAGAVIFIFLNVAFKNGYYKGLFLDSFFQVASIITTTGYSSLDYGNWPMFSKYIIFILMFIGGCAGSTAGGLKVSRIGVLLRVIKSEIQMIVNPNRIKSIKFDGKVLSDSTVRGIMSYFTIYVFIFFVLVGIISLDARDFGTSISAVAATFNNVGPGFNDVGPSRSFSGFNSFSKMVLSFAMIAGRLELYPVILLLVEPFNKK